MSPITWPHGPTNRAYRPTPFRRPGRVPFAGLCRPPRAGLRRVTQRCARALRDCACDGIRVIYHLRPTPQLAPDIRPQPDVGVGALVQAWGFGPAQGVADPKAIGALMGKPIRSFDALELDMAAGRARKTAAMSLDLSGIAKGFGVDVLAAVLADHGVTQCLCGLDGELVARGLRPDGKPWAVALEQPDPTRRAGRSMVELTDRAIATSGSYRHFVTLGNLRVSHTMNPRTGGPAVGALVSVSVLHDSCMQADAWATVLMVLGDQAGPEFAKAQGLQAIFLAEVGGEIRETLTGFAPE